MAIPIHLQTFIGQVMHDIGQLYHATGTAPRARDALRLAMARQETTPISNADVQTAATQALRDWRATQRVKGFAASDPIDRGYLTGRSEIKTIGVRVVLELRYPRRRPAGMPMKASVLVTVRPATTVQQAINAAVVAWNTHTLQLPRSSNQIARATGNGEIVQIVEGGWSHAQVEA